MCDRSTIPGEMLLLFSGGGSAALGAAAGASMTAAPPPSPPGIPPVASFPGLGEGSMSREAAVRTLFVQLLRVRLLENKRAVTCAGRKEVRNGQQHREVGFVVVRVVLLSRWGTTGVQHMCAGFWCGGS